MQISSILAEMKLNQSIVKTFSDPNECFVRIFKIRLGRHRQIKYYTPGGPQTSRRLILLFIGNLEELYAWKKKITNFLFLIGIQFTRLGF
jgi:hypothetical protein